MSNLYGDRHRELQDAFETRHLADAIEAAIYRTALTEQDQSFVAARDMFFLSTIDHRGCPTVSYKGGDPGFVHVVDEQTIAFPSYDGNGMFLSLGNLSGCPSIGLLFIDFERPNRLRVQGEAALDVNDPLRGVVPQFAEADAIVRVAVREVWQNCPRYVHPHAKRSASEFVPRSDSETPVPDWKRLDDLQPALPARDRERVAQTGGTISGQEYAARESAALGGASDAPDG